MDIVYKKVNAQITPEALAKLKQKKIIFESTNQQKLKGRYSIVVFDHYGKITLDNSQLLIKLKFESPFHLLSCANLHLPLDFCLLQNIMITLSIKLSDFSNYLV